MEQQPKLKDHEIAQVINDLTKIAREYGQTQQLRECLSTYLVPVLKNEPRVSIDSITIRKQQ